MPPIGVLNIIDALMLQGVGALGACQVGAFAARARRGHSPRDVNGMSIGAINSAIIAGNFPGNRVARPGNF